MLFSIITVTRNNLDGLKRTHESLRVQTCADYEWIVIDGASDDGTAGYLNISQARWISEPDRGIYDAMNKGIARAQGDFLIFMNAGDVFAAPDVLERLAAYECADFIYGNALEGRREKAARSHTKISLGMFTHHQAMVYRRELVGDLRYDLKYKIAADYKLTAEFLRRVERVEWVPFAICDFEAGGVSQKGARAGRSEQFAIRHELRLCGRVENFLISGAQLAVMALRRASPALYWHIRKISGAAGGF